MWRCFSPRPKQKKEVQICSTHVEMFPIQTFRNRLYEDLLHACGDVSDDFIKELDAQESAPRMWRCFHSRHGFPKALDICSTHVEMFPAPARCISSRRDLLHACGDVSRPCPTIATAGASAPRMWRCFRPGAQGDERASICSTHVEMFLRRNACGDVSPSSASRASATSSAPRMWRCFPHGDTRDTGHNICSTHVEMFLSP